jgi:hypothetical protein
MDLDFFKRYPVFTAVLAVCLIAFLTEVVFVFRANGAAQKAQKSLKAAESSLTTALNAQPAASAANLQSAQQNVKDLQGQLDGIIQSMQSAGNFTTPPTDAVTLLADIQHFVDTFTAAAKAKNVLIAAPGNFTFGMGQYVGPVPPPPPDKIAVVFKQMENLEYILNQLLAAKPDDQVMLLESVERENAVPDPNAANSPNPTQPKDTFALDPLMSAKVAGAVDTLAFRIKFVAYSDALRGFLGALAKFDYPLVVRSVEVTPAPEESLKVAQAAANPAAAAAAAVVLPGADSAAPAADASAPATPTKQAVIKTNLSEFTVVIEYINLITPKPTGAPSA